ncbi:hypothetical protein BJX70DRAFT_409399 [Aspergillus crustosus]
MSSPVRRPYRSKRHPPCDRCRQKKLRCDADDQIACRRCQRSGDPCSFNRLHRSVSIPVATVYTENTTSYTPTDSPPSQPLAFLPEVPLTYSLPDRPAPQQAIQTLDLLLGVSAQVIGTSGESDPFLLRHCKFDDYGLLHFHHLRFRNAGGVPLEEKIPVHFLVTDNAVNDPMKASTSTPSQYPSSRDELNAIIPLEYGQRLLSLFITFVFPSLPVVPHFIVSDNLQTIPVHLLAALYASALPFVKCDDWLSVVYAYQPPPAAQLWRLCFDIILAELHTPHLSVLQAGLLYLQKPMISPSQSSAADTSFGWSFVGMMVGLATSLGLQLECRIMGMPLWERRIRRRLWWAIYSEEKWRSLLLGRPPYLRDDEWDVTDLDEGDFETVPAEKFMRVVKLARIADEIQVSLYSLRSAQRLSSNFPDSLQMSRVLLRKLQEWISLPHSLTQDGTTIGPDLSTCVHFCYLLLEVFIFRALLRPMVLSAPPPRLIDESETIPFFPELTVDDYIAQIIDFDDLGVQEVVGEEVPAVSLANQDKSMPIVLNAAENCAASVIRLISRMEARDIGTFWYSWCRVGFATVSNFLLLLLVQAPSKEHAERAKKLGYMWQQALQSQSRGWDLMDLGLVRLNAPLGMGLANSFYLPSHIKQVFETTMRLSKMPKVTPSGLLINQKSHKTGLARLALIDEDASVRRWFAREVKKLGCSLSIDQMGNMFARQQGRLSSSAPMIAMGSHLDTQPWGGRYNGILGVVAALEMSYDIGIVNWTNEERARFPKSMCSSGVWAGGISIQNAWNLRDINDSDVTLRSELERHGYLGDIPCSHDANPLGAHFELHTEQGPVLQDTGRSIGVITGAQGCRWLKFTVTGQDAHTGTTPFSALTKWPSVMGILKIPDNSSTNTVVSDVVLTLDIRHPDDHLVHRVQEECLQQFHQIAGEDGRGVSFEWTLDIDLPAVQFYPDCTRLIKTAADLLLVSKGWMEMTSSAGYDSVYTSRHCPSAMIFVPCRDGVSHHPTEYCSSEDCALGTQVLLESVVNYDRHLLDTPDDQSIYPSLADKLALLIGLPVVRLDYRVAARTEHCVPDVVATMDYMQKYYQSTQFVVIGWSFGGSPCFTVAAQEPERVRGIATVASQTAQTSGINKLSPRPLLLLHGGGDTCLSQSCSESLYRQYGPNGSRELKIFPGDNHGLSHHAPEAEGLLLGFAARTLGFENDLTPVSLKIAEQDWVGSEAERVMEMEEGHDLEGNEALNY